MQFQKRKVQITLSNYHKSPILIFNYETDNKSHPTAETGQIWPPKVVYFVRIKNI